MYQRYFDNDDRVNAFDTVGSQICNVVFTEDLNLKKNDIENVEDFYSERGFKKILKQDRKNIIL